MSCRHCNDTEDEREDGLCGDCRHALAYAAEQILGRIERFGTINQVECMRFLADAMPNRGDETND